ncbi:MAG TPA: pyridoxamine 5'-phosphate oxidase family protein [Nitrososphaerales archaeon]|nr:pyridoxamine 5'-phosphate oxidase family protein [Nitrososphaerales archaeon]
MFETRAELEGLQRLLDESFERSDNIRYSGFGPEHRLSAAQLAGFQGVRLMAVASVNSKGEPRAAPRSAAFLHGKFYLASNSKSTMVRRLALHPALGFTYFESRLLIIGHGEPALLRRGTTAFKEASPQWVEAFRGGEDALEGMDLLLRLDADHLVAFAANPDRYPEGWRTTRSHHR